MKEYRKSIAHANYAIKKQTQRSITFANVQYTMRSEGDTTVFFNLDLVCRIMKFEDQRCLGLFLLKLKRHRDNLLREQTATGLGASTQRSLKNFLNRISVTTTTPYPPITEPQNGEGHSRGVAVERGIALCKSRRPQPPGPRSQLPHHHQI